MVDRISIGQVYDEVIKVQVKLDSMGKIVQQNCVDIALLQQRDVNHGAQEDKRDKRIESLDDAVNAIQLDNARAIRTSAIIGALIAAIAGIVVAIIK